MKIGIIGGNGWLGSAIGLSMLASGFVSPGRLALSCRSGRAPAFASWPDVRVTRDNAELAAHAELIILSVRPEQFAAVDIDASGKLLVSLMAGIDLETLGRRTGARRIVRAMPNAAAEIGLSYTPWFAAPDVDGKDKALVADLFATCGLADEMDSEAGIDIMTGLSGSGTAFPALLASAMLSYARAGGIDPAIARRAVLTTLEGAARMMARDQSDPGEVVKAFADYRGTTAAGLEAMMAAGFEKAVIDGLEAAEMKARAMAASFRAGAERSSP
jgi:pyrroline-5-carboxylate reductase